MLRDLVKKAQENDKEAMLKLIEQFAPLLRKYSRKLNYEDSYEEMTLFFIELIKSFRLDKLSCTEDGVITAYINVSVRHFHDKKIAESINRQKEIPLSDLTEEQVYYAQASCAREDTASLFLEFNTGNLLNQREQRVIHQIFVEGYTTAEIARLSHKSRQAVNQLKHRALKKLRDAWEGAYHTG